MSKSQKIRIGIGFGEVTVSRHLERGNGLKRHLRYDMSKSQKIRIGIGFGEVTVSRHLERGNGLKRHLRYDMSKSQKIRIGIGFGELTVSRHLERGIGLKRHLRYDMSKSLKARVGLGFGEATVSRHLKRGDGLKRHLRRDADLSLTFPLIMQRRAARLGDKEGGKKRRRCRRRELLSDVSVTGDVKPLAESRRLEARANWHLRETRIRARGHSWLSLRPSDDIVASRLDHEFFVGGVSPSVILARTAVAGVRSFDTAVNRIVDRKVAADSFEFHLSRGLIRSARTKLQRCKFGHVYSCRDSVRAGLFLSDTPAWQWPTCPGTSSAACLSRVSSHLLGGRQPGGSPPPAAP
ncbi:hypothetical protein J6590_014588 [Homalodisca vitripennis]|nr:hypothetical protein J6590_014588 [Homalodisca vitripennis]